MQVLSDNYLCRGLFTGLLLCAAVKVWADGPRWRIDEPLIQCNFNAEDGSSKATSVYPHACAEALRRVKVGEGGDWGELSEPPERKNALALAQGWFQDRSYPSDYHDPGYYDMPVFHPLSRGRFLLALHCANGAYNTGRLFVAYDETRLPARAWVLRFPGLAEERGRYQVCIGTGEFSHRRATIYEYWRERGMGDAGYYARYAIDRCTLRPRLLEVIVKHDWDMRDAFPGIGYLDVKPKGKGWKRVYPPEVSSPENNSEVRTYQMPDYDGPELDYLLTPLGVGALFLYRYLSSAINESILIDCRG